MSNIDVDALTEQAAAAQYESSKWPYYQEEVRVAARGRVRPIVEFVAARVEQDVADRIERAMFGDTDGGWVSDDSELPVGELRRLLSLARGGSDVG